MSTTANPSEPVVTVADSESIAELRGIRPAASVLLTDAEYKHSLGILRQLGRLGVKVSVVASSRDSLLGRSRFCHQMIRSEGSSTEACLEAAYRAVQQNHYDLLMPVSFPMTLAVARNRDKFLPYVPLALAATAAIERAADKAEMARVASKIAVPAPKTSVLRNLNDLAQQIDGMNFPVVVKPVKESRKGAVAYARNMDQLRRICGERLSGLETGAWEAQLLQEYIPGYGCGFFATYQRGVCKRIFMHRRVREFPVDGGASSCAESFFDPALLNYGRSILDELRWHGVAMVEFRCDSRDGRYKLIEVNPKFWGSLDLALAAGADFPGDLLKMAQGQDLPFTDRYQRDLRFQWPLSGHGDLFHLWKRPGSFVSVLSDILNPKVKNNISWSDPGPNLQELGGLAAAFLRLSRRKN